MQKRTLGNSGIEVPPLCFGCNVFGWTVDDSTGFQLLDALVTAGLNFLDTADVYSRWAPGNSGGESETLIGNWLKQRGSRDKVIIATKVGMDMGRGKKGLKGSYIMQAVEDSLRRLQTDYIDLYQSHVDDQETPLEETLAAYDQLIKAGKVRAIGASNYDAGRFAHALRISEENGLSRYESLQPNYNLYDRAGFEAELEPLCLEKGIGVINYFSLAKGFLTGKYRSEADLTQSPRGVGVKQYLNDRGFRILAALDHVAEESNSTPTSAALAWQIARPSVTAPIASATSLEQLNDLIAATRLDLDSEAIETLNRASGYE
ncbi:MAG: aldo/keto reductase [Acidobacteria bacterium]|nr:aldo/keto reductase [Acidobacteriota bacterium]